MGHPRRARRNGRVPDVGAVLAECVASPFIWSTSKNRRRVEVDGSVVVVNFDCLPTLGTLCCKIAFRHLRLLGFPMESLWNFLDRQRLYGIQGTNTLDTGVGLGSL